MTVPAPRRILITGAGGMLGNDLVRAARLSGLDVRALDRAALDITHLGACRSAMDGVDVVLNAAAWTDVDAAEMQEAEASSINAAGAVNLAVAARDAGATMVQYSTDYVFSGEESGPWSEDAEIAPLNAYGRTKADGERGATSVHPGGTIVMRTAWLYGEHGANFVSTMLRLYRERGTLTVVDDQHGQPTWTRDLAEKTLQLLASGVRSGTFHGTNSGSTTWFGFAQAIVENVGGDPDDVHPTSSDNFPRPARRPANSVLGHDGWSARGLEPLRPWRAALDEYMSLAH